MEDISARLTSSRTRQDREKVAVADLLTGLQMVCTRRGGAVILGVWGCSAIPERRAGERALYDWYTHAMGRLRARAGPVTDERVKAGMDEGLESGAPSDTLKWTPIGFTIIV